MKKYIVILDKEVKTEDGLTFDRAEYFCLDFVDKCRFLINTYRARGILKWMPTMNLYKYIPKDEK